MLKFHLQPHVIAEVTHLLAGDAKLTQWFVAEMKERAENELAVALADQALVSADNFKATHRPIGGVGQCVMRMAKTMHDWIMKWVGAEFVYDEAFLRQLVRDNPHLCLRPAYLKRASIIVEKPWVPSNGGARMGECGSIHMPQSPEPAKAGTTIQGRLNRLKPGLQCEAPDTLKREQQAPDTLLRSREANREQQTPGATQQAG